MSVRRRRQLFLGFDCQFYWIERGLLSPRAHSRHTTQHLFWAPSQPPPSTRTRWTPASTPLPVSYTMANRYLPPIDRYSPPTDRYSPPTATHRQHKTGPATSSRTRAVGPPRHIADLKQWFAPLGKRPGRSLLGGGAFRLVGWCQIARGFDWFDGIR